MQSIARGRNHSINNNESPHLKPHCSSGSMNSDQCAPSDSTTLFTDFNLWRSPPSAHTMRPPRLTEGGLSSEGGAKQWSVTMPSSGHNEHNTPPLSPPLPTTTNTYQGFQFVPVNFAERNLHRLQRRCIIIKCSHWFIALIRCFVPRPPSNRVQKYDLRFPLLLSTDDRFPRNYFKPCWPHTRSTNGRTCLWPSAAAERLNLCWSEQVSLSITEAIIHFCQRQGGTSVTLMKNWLSGENIYIYKWKHKWIPSARELWC